MNEELKQRWEVARANLLREISAIDAATPWSSTEPSWWLNMMEAQTYLIRSRQESSEPPK